MAASVAQLMARIVDIFGPVATASVNAMWGNFMVSPTGNVLIGTQTDDASHKLQVTGTAIVSGGLRVNGTGVTFPDGTTQTTAGAAATASSSVSLGLAIAMTVTNPIL